MSELHVTLVREGVLDEAVLRRLLDVCGDHLSVSKVLPRRHFGKDMIRRNLHRYRQAARHSPFIVLVDLDDVECPPALLSEWGVAKDEASGFVFRVAVRSVEAWLLGDAEEFAAFMSIPRSRIPAQPETCDDPKQTIVTLARRSRKRTIREGIVPRAGTSNRVGPLYTILMRRFVYEHWRIDIAREVCPSLDRALRRIAALGNP